MARRYGHGFLSYGNELRELDYRGLMHWRIAIIESGSIEEYCHDCPALPHHRCRRPRRLPSRSRQVVVNYSGRHEAADAVVARIKNKGGEAIAVQADVSNPAAAALFDAARAAFGGIDVLVNNAGFMLPR